ncbi:hypothetical protein J5277_22930 [Rhizobium sp. 16-449-1b]|uniref:hypothetical protein n=1 Tax=Rhizobium sp. 16-449-1b TaxID=2819989 RepID=UPI001AD954B3|nr:hypothetical protein [Rhizobium sp. 16-449-1b]MBO9196972.1 hypothetical protein [Rhizobium sp. 16-449-1b]
MEDFRFAAGAASPFDEAFWLRLAARLPIENLQRCNGGQSQQFFPPEHAKWAASNLKDAQLYLVPKMGHALDPAFIEGLVERLAAFLTSTEINAKALRFA